MKPTKKRKQHRFQKGWSRIEIIMLLTFLLELINTIIDHWN